jgi:hypothetical protein
MRAPEVAVVRPRWQWPSAVVRAEEEAREVRHVTWKMLGLAARAEEAQNGQNMMR